MADVRGNQVRGQDPAAAADMRDDQAEDKGAAVTADAGSVTDGPYRDIQSLIRATHDGLVRAAFRLLGNRADAEDAVQEGCINVMRSWPRVSRLPTARQQRAYLLTAVANEALQILRQPYRKRERPEASHLENAHVTDEAGQAAVEHLRLVWKAISELPEGRREVVILFAAGYEYREIAKALGVQVSTVRSHISNARKHLPRPTPGGLGGGTAMREGMPAPGGPEGGPE